MQEFCQEQRKLVSGKYFSLLNETIATVTDGSGEKVHHNLSGDITSKEVYVNQDIAYTEEYHPNGTPKAIISYKNGLKHGEEKGFAMSGEPLYIENYVDDLKDGLCTYYQNGSKYLETQYSKGLKDGIERHFIDGATLAEETEYQAGLKHGPSVIFCEGDSRTSWYFKDAKVTKSTFDQYVERDYMITSAQR